MKENKYYLILLRRFVNKVTAQYVNQIIYAFHATGL